MTRLTQRAHTVRDLLVIASMESVAIFVAHLVIEGFITAH